ncbi:MAG TPA: hypothetical protein VI636_09975 [Candidatus Angelobacter sp.]
MWNCSFRLDGIESQLDERRRKSHRRVAHAVAAAVAPLGPAVTLVIVAVAAFLFLPPGQARITSITTVAVPGENGTVSAMQGRFVDVAGSVSNPDIQRIFLDVNGLVRGVTVDHGKFGSRVGLIPGTNRIQASADPRGFGWFGGSQAVTIVAAIPPSDIWTELTWDGPGDIDLHLLQPDGEECSYSNPQAKSGASLDFDNTVQDGPEHITVPRAAAGVYQVKVVYFAASGGSSRKVPWNVTLRMRNGAIQRYSGVLETVKDEQTVAVFRWL